MIDWALLQGFEQQKPYAVLDMLQAVASWTMTIMDSSLGLAQFRPIEETQHKLELFA